MIDRRHLLALLSLCLATPAAAQQRGTARTVAVLSWWAPGGQDTRADLEQRFGELGYVIGKDLIVEYHFAHGDRARVTALAKELDARRLDVLICLATPAAEIAKSMVQSTPIVFQVADALRTGIVASLAHPGGNLTGVSTTSTELSGKRLELLRETVPSLQSVAFIGSALDPNGPVFAAETEAAGRALGLHVRPFLLKGPDEFAATFAAIREARIGAAFVQPLFVQFRKEFSAMALEHRLPVIADQRAFVDAGALMALGTSRRWISRKLADYADKIIKGAKPADLPVEQPTDFDLIVNLKTAKALGLTIPPTILVRATEVIE